MVLPHRTQIVECALAVSARSPSHTQFYRSFLDDSAASTTPISSLHATNYIHTQRYKSFYRCLGIYTPSFFTALTTQPALAPLQPATQPRTQSVTQPSLITKTQPATQPAYSHNTVSHTARSQHSQQYSQSYSQLARLGQLTPTHPHSQKQPDPTLGEVSISLQ